MMMRGYLLAWLFLPVFVTACDDRECIESETIRVEDEVTYPMVIGQVTILLQQPLGTFHDEVKCVKWAKRSDAK